MNKKKAFEEGLAQDIMQQFMNEVVEPTNNPPKVYPKSVKVVSKAEQGRPLDVKPLPTGRSSSKESPNQKVQGKWKERFESAKQIPHSVPLRHEYNSADTREAAAGQNQERNQLEEAYDPYFVKPGSFAKPKFVEEAMLKETQQSYFQKENKPDNRQDNKWLARKNNQNAAAPKTSAKPPQIQKQNPGLETEILKKEIEKGGNANQILKRAAKNLEQHDPELAAKAQEYFFEKIGVALLNNFKKNLVPCSYCGRNFDSSKLS